MDSARHPVRLVVTDDGRRSRLTVLLRVLLALPHLAWLLGWSIAASVAGFANWLAVVISGETPPVFHSFLGAYVRYTTHVGAYLFLAANPYPGFRGRPGYPVDVELAPPGRQRRLSAALRLLLALPALALAETLGGLGSAGQVVATAAVLLWFAALVLGRAPLGLRDLTAYSLGYSAQALAYLFLVVGRYPDSHPDRLLSAAAPRRHPVRLRVEDGLRRSRLTTLFRLPLTMPHLVWLAGWSVLALAAVLVAWPMTLLHGRTPRGLHRFLAAFVRYSAHVSAFATLVGNPFPGFVGRQNSYPVAVVIDGPAPQRRLVTLFRLPARDPGAPGRQRARRAPARRGRAALVRRADPRLGAVRAARGRSDDDPLQRPGGRLSPPRHRPLPDATPTLRAPAAPPAEPPPAEASSA